MCRPIDSIAVGLSDRRYSGLTRRLAPRRHGFSSHRAPSGWLAGLGQALPSRILCPDDLAWLVLDRLRMHQRSGKALETPLEPPKTHCGPGTDVAGIELTIGPLFQPSGLTRVPCLITLAF